MAGNYAKPYRLLPTGSNIPTAAHAHYSGCDVFNYWQNITKVRPKGDTGGPNYTATPYKREDPTFAAAQGDSCAVAGNCGLWIRLGNWDGLVDHNIELTVPDITTCAALPVVSADHNCYQLNGTVDNRNCNKVGAKWVLARKMWHGVYGWTSKDACASPADYSPDQTRYLSHNPAADFHFQRLAGSHALSLIDEFITNSTGVQSIDRYSGLITNGVVTSEDIYGMVLGSFIQTKHCSGGAGWIYATPSNKTYESGLTTLLDDIVTVYHCNYLPVIPYLGFTFQELIDQINSFGGSVPDITDYDSYPEQSGTFNRDASTEINYRISFSRSATEFTFDIHYDYKHFILDNPLDENEQTIYDFSGTIALGTPYTAADLAQDLKDACDAWDISDDKVMAWQSREDLANSPLICYNEKPNPVQTFGFITATMNDYAAGLINDPDGNSPGDPGYTTTWAQRAWADPSDYDWLYPGNTFVQPGGFTSGATLLGAGQVGTGYPVHFLDGTIISHNAAGFDSHFWFGFQHYERLGICDPETLTFLGTNWSLSYNGGFSYSDGRTALPSTTLRWQTKIEAQYDGQIYAPSLPPPVYGNLPQSWYREIYGVAYLGKYVETKVPWPSVNYGRPYGIDKWAVSNETACAIIAAGVIRKTGNAIDPLATGGLQIGDTVLVGGDGVYPITGLAATSGNTDWPVPPRNQFTYTLGSKIADIPALADIEAGYTARLRWWTAPPFGLTEISQATYDSGADETTFTIGSTPFWVSESGAPMTKNVDLYVKASNGNPGATVLANVTITKALVDDLTVTCPGNHTTAEFLIPHLHYSGVQFKPCYDDDTPKGDSLRAEWAFDLRGESATVTPTWWNGLNGVTNGTITTIHTKFAPCCPSVIGFASSGVEVFQNASIGGLPIDSLTTDSIYGAFWQGAVFQNMNDPFWTAPFVPDLDEELNWVMDDGYGHDDDEFSVPPTRYYAHAPQVEAIQSKPTGIGWTGTDTPPDLPAGVALTYDQTVNPTAPPYWPNGIPFAYVTEGCDIVNSDFTNLTTSYGFYNFACSCIQAGRRFAADYQKFLYC